MWSVECCVVSVVYIVCNECGCMCDVMCVVCSVCS